MKDRRPHRSRNWRTLPTEGSKGRKKEKKKNITKSR